jgi:hypothetical protein
MISLASAASVLLYLLAWASLLSLPLFDRPVKQSEKSLMVNGANPSIPPDSIHNAFNRQPLDNLSLTLESLGIETYVERGNGCGFIHGIVRSKRGDGKESIILVTPISLTPTLSESLLIRSGLILVDHFSNVQWLAKDLIWLVVFHCSLNCTSSSILSRWLDQYQNGKGAGPRFTRAGVLQQGLVLSAQDSDSGLSKANINLVGHDGLLPKLDTYHLLRGNSWLLSRLNILMDPYSDPTSSSQGQSGLSRYLAKLQHMKSMIIQTTSCKPAGAHAEFKRFMVDAANLHLTLAPLLSSGPDSDVTALKIAEFLELVFRSLNNLSERMHHSYFLYLLTSSSTFITVEFYIIPVVLLILIPATQAVSSVLELNALTASTAGSKGIEQWVRCLCYVMLSSATSLSLLFSAPDMFSSLPDTLILALAASLIPLMTTKAFSLLIQYNGQRDLQLKLKVVALSLSVATLSVLACLNPWLSFAASAFLVVPLSSM